MRQSIRRILAVAVATAVIAPLGVTSAYAATESPNFPPVPWDGRVVYFEPHMSAEELRYWDIATYIEWVDKYTASDSRLLPYGVDCPAAGKCVELWEHEYQPEKVGYAWWSSQTIPFNDRWGEIWFNPRARNFSAAAKWRIAVHEIAHVHGVTWHSSSNNFMHDSIYWSPGVLVDYTWGAAARDRLRVN